MNWDYKKQFPKKLILLWKEYSIDFISENRDELRICIGLNKRVIKHYVFGKNEWYINMVYFDNIVARNFEWYLYWKEVEWDNIEFDARDAVFYKYWRKWTVL